MRLTPAIITSPKELQAQSLAWRTEGSVALVPTMGCLHEGHQALIRHARELASRVIVSIFVNPLQFGPNEDFEKYPRTFDADVEVCAMEDVDLIFRPGVSDLYPEEFSTRVIAGDLSRELCGKFRPGHFDGVATVCLKLFDISQASLSIFGEKDFQQLRVLEQMVSDFNLPLRIVRFPTVRESDGLALSSRNRYLSSQEREWAQRIPRALTTAVNETSAHSGVTVGGVIESARCALLEAPLEIEYLEIASAQTLKPQGPHVRLDGIESPRIFLAARAGRTRLIDNMSLKG